MVNCTGIFQALKQDSTLSWDTLDFSEKNKQIINTVLSRVITLPSVEKIPTRCSCPESPLHAALSRLCGRTHLKVDLEALVIHLGLKSDQMQLLGDNQGGLQ